ncbi:MAG: hypothetical protein QXI89_02270 [Candidatus Anstonellales archaeon]
MKIDPYLHAVLLLYGAGQDVSAEKILSVIKAAGLQADEAKAKVLAEAVKGISIDELLKEATTAAVVAAPVQASATEAKEEKKAEKEEKKEEEAAAGLASLFG